MSFSLLRKHRPWSGLTVQGTLLVVLGAVLYWLAYQLHTVLQPYVAYAQGVDLLFLPAGIKLVMVMIAGWRGALGCGLALWWMTYGVWPELGAWEQLVYVALSVGVTAAVVQWTLAHKACGPALEGLHFWDIVQVDFFNTVLHALLVNLYFWGLGLRAGAELPSAVLAMALGDFLGTGVVLFAVLLVAQLFRLGWRR